MISIKINVRMGKYKAGSIVRVKELDHFWRRRLDDASVDGCCEIVDDVAAATPAKKSGAKKAK